MKRRRTASGIIRESITEALILLMKKQPYESISITGLTKKAGVGRVSFYRHFKSKDDILIQKLDEVGADWWRQQAGQSGVNYAYALACHGQTIREILLLLYQHDLRHLLLTNIWHCCGASAEDAAESAYAKSVLAGAVFGLCDEWIRRGMAETPEEIGRIFAGLDQMLVSGASPETMP